MRRWLDAPTFEDELLTQRARLLHHVMVAILVILAPFTLVSFFTAARPLFAVFSFGGVAAITAVMLVALRRGHVTAVASAWVALYFAFETALFWFNGGVSPNQSVTYIIIVLLAGLTISPSAGGVAALVTTLATAVLGWAEARGLLPPPMQPTTVVQDAISNSAAFIFGAAFVGVSMKSLHQALERARTARAVAQRRADQHLALSTLGTLAVTEPTAHRLAEAVVTSVANTLAAQDVLALDTARGRDVLASVGEVNGLGEVLPPQTSLHAEGNRRVVVAPLAVRGSPRGVLAATLGDAGADDEEVLAFVTTAASMLGARIAHEEDNAMLRQGQKMDVVGRLAGGVAHDFNNLLTTILGCTSLLERQATGETAELVRDIREASERAALMTRQLLAFSRKQVLRPQPLDLNATVSGFYQVLQRLLRSDVTMELTLDASAPTVVMDKVSLEQVLLNLAVNARDAMPGGGRLHISTRAEPGEVRLEVRDTGAGMDEATRRRLFEPFFTTRADGTGLGLATVLGIIERAGGRIDVTSAPGAGSTFTLVFPTTGAALTPPSRVTPTVPGGARVLLVDDDDAVRGVVRRLLEGAGHLVLEASTAADALRQADAGANFDLLVTDMVLPDIDGAELARRVTARHLVPTLFVSGYVADNTPGERFVAKPFTPEELLAAVHQALDDGAAKR